MILKSKLLNLDLKIQMVPQPQAPTKFNFTCKEKAYRSPDYFGFRRLLHLKRRPKLQLH